MLDEAKVLKPGNKYRNDKSAQLFGKTIAQFKKNKLADVIKQISFITLTSDGSTGSSITEQEIVFVRFSNEGLISTKFVGLGTPVNQDGT